MKKVILISKISIVFLIYVIRFDNKLLNWHWSIIFKNFQACVRYQQYFLQPILTSLTNESVDLRQTASYTIGVLGQYGGPEFVKYCSGKSLL